MQRLRSAEHQVKVFAGAFLIHDGEAAGKSVQEISEQFLVSFEAAQLCWKRLLKKAERARSAERVLKMSEEVKVALLGNSGRKTNYLEEICTVCKRQTLVPRGDGNKVSCETCGFQGERFQDGDRML
jgi:hypothetical protein